MSNFIQAAYNPDEDTVRAAAWIDNHFGAHRYGVIFDTAGPVYTTDEVTIPIDAVFVRQKEES